jgi:hypothetical protein
MTSAETKPPIQKLGVRQATSNRGYRTNVVITIGRR